MTPLHHPSPDALVGRLSDRRIADSRRVAQENHTRERRLRERRNVMEFASMEGSR